MAWLSEQTRSTLAVLWALFVFFWLLLAGLVMGVTHAFACGGLSDAPSPEGGYCDAAHDYFKSGEPGELTTALVYGWPVGVLVGLGLLGVLNRRAGLLLWAAVAAVGALLLHVFLSLTA